MAVAPVYSKAVILFLVVHCCCSHCVYVFLCLVRFKVAYAAVCSKAVVLLLLLTVCLL